MKTTTRPRGRRSTRARGPVTVAVHPGGRYTGLWTERHDGKRYNSPNDAVVDGRGRTWFTDPYYGDDPSFLEMGCEAVYRIDPNGRVTRALSQPEIERPNGLALTPDGKTLYVVDSHTRGPAETARSGPST